MLLDEGYASILLEMRVHGESEGEVIALGYEEYLDVQAVVDYIKRNHSYSGVPIVVYGLAMGGAAAVCPIVHRLQIRLRQAPYHPQTANPESG
jgi:uncharacterized protein